MVELRPQGVAVGTIFPYKQALTKENLAEYFDSAGFNVSEEEGQGINITPQGIGIGPSPIFATNENLQVLVNLDADLPGFENSSFVTIKTQKGADSDRVIEAVEDFWRGYSDIDIPENKSLVEVTIEGQIRIDKNKHKLTRLYAEEKLEPLKRLSDNDPEGITVHFQPSGNNRRDDWYRIQIDSQKAGPPHDWAFKSVRRYNSYKDIDVNATQDSIEALVDNTATE